MFEAIVDVILIDKDQGQAEVLNILSNDIEAVGAQVVSLCNARTVGDDGGFSQKGSAGGHFWVNPAGDAWFFPGDDFRDLADGDFRETFCIYEAQDESGETVRGYLFAKVFADASGIKAQAMPDSDSFLNIAEQSPVTDLTRNDVGVGAKQIVEVAGSKNFERNFISARGDGGGLFTVDRNGAATFRPNGDFSSLAPGQKATTSVRYTMRDSKGQTSASSHTVTVIGSAQSGFTQDDHIFAVGPEVRQQINVFANDKESDLKVVDVEGAERVRAGWRIRPKRGVTLTISHDGSVGLRTNSTVLASLDTGKMLETEIRLKVESAQGIVEESLVKAMITSGKEDEATIEFPEKIGIGAWLRKGGFGQFANVGTFYDSLCSGWYYSWTTEPIDGVRKTDFVPMVWDDSSYFFNSDGSLAASLSELSEPNNVLLGFNEPDVAAQANMSVGRALELWSQLERTGARLGSPAPGKDGLDGSAWLTQFMEQAELANRKVDFVTLHIYPDSFDPSAVRNYLIEAYAKFGKPIWVTEFALANWELGKNKSAFTEEEQAAFLEATYKIMDDLPFVERYAWFSPIEGGDGWTLNSGYVNQENGTRTAVGDRYFSLLPGTCAVQ